MVFGLVLDGAFVEVGFDMERLGRCATGLVPGKLVVCGGGGDGEEEICMPLLVGDNIRSLDKISISVPILPL